MELMVPLFVMLYLRWMEQQGHLELTLLGGNGYALPMAHTLWISVMPSPVLQGEFVQCM